MISRDERHTLTDRQTGRQAERQKLTATVAVWYD